ncbi:PLP-dependent aminotransferase family protein [Rhizobium sp. NPDC090275]|uniref:MocR-like pyridoxine biosynthesis transcription factor PdxR n=1 Tax=Rhizobium sp. NPDC090275 TaxID=3364498 RepID=UPI000DDEB5E7
MAAASTAWLPIERALGDLEGQIYRELRERILSGEIAAGQRLPSTRDLSRSLGLARSTVVNAYERLKAEGYLEARSGSASRVAVLNTSPLGERAKPAAPMPTMTPAPSMLLEPGPPDLEHFPHAAWARCLAARARRLRIHDLGYGDACGLRDLREAIAEHLAATRGVTARPEQVLILPSTRVAIDLLAGLRLKDAGSNRVWMEEPGYPSAKTLMRAAGGEIVPIACDAAGIDVGKAGGLPPSIIYVTPSHQYPTGATMSLQRRLALLDLAQATGALILEDDYDSDFQYGSRPIASLQGIDRNGVVAYLGTFSKILAPGLRVAYAIVPSWLAAEASAALQMRGAVVSVHIQAALADFIRDGRLRAYLRQMNAIYATRMRATTDALRRHCGHLLDIAEGAGGLQLASWFKDASVDDEDIARALRGHGLAPQPMSRFHVGTPRTGLLFGIARVVPAEIDVIAARLAKLIEAQLERGAVRASEEA